MQNVDKFIKLINEDKDRVGSEKKLELLTAVSKGTINSWRGNLKNAPRIDTLNLYISNIDAPIERKRLYYEYCGYPVPAELLTDGVPETPKNESDFSKKELEHLEKYRSLDKYGVKVVDNVTNIEFERLEEEKEVLKNRKKINLPDGAVAYVLPDDKNITTKTS